ncbi:histidine phosphatase family protein [Alteromonas sp. C1M14]|uniref:histidine phosphatase family protein n=1 Tax=Alteromonas sp. C1M14 TaxID=2841567 RepID=UPI001C0A3A50|nr:histidine phosphatase family protein [Alteromonas sp. C1M14]MBU2979621.1 histidine phosphatase family protein [Alteromonas sp. C1M14]
MNRIIDLLRHGSVEGEPALYGRTDVPLSPRGKAQMLAHLPVLKTVDNIISSPLIRCLSAAEAIGHLVKAPVNPLPSLQECDFGELDGVPFDHLQSQWPLLEAFWQQPAKATLPQAESLPLFHERVLNGWQQILSQDGKHLLVVSHGGAIRQILAHLLGINWTQPALYQQLAIGYGSRTRITIDDHPNALPVVRYIGLEGNEAPSNDA